MDRHQSRSKHALRRWVPLLGVLVGAMLIASVLAPAHESARVLALLDDDAQLIEPARSAMRRLESGVAEEFADLHLSSPSRDSAASEQARTTAERVDSAARDLRSLSDSLDSKTALQIAALSALVARWQALTGSIVHGAEPPALPSSTDALHDSIVSTSDRLQLEFAGLAAERRSSLAAHERRGLFVNAALVLIALAAVIVVLEVSRRDLRRVRREAVLREAAESFAGSFTKSEVEQQVAREAMELLCGRAASVCSVVDGDRGERTVVVAGSHGASSAWQAFPGEHQSPVLNALDRGEPSVVAPFDGQERPFILVPLGPTGVRVGAFVIVESDSHRFREDDLAWAGILGKLAFLALEKVRLLEEARDGRYRLERAMESRGRLIRGFSHDVKNPLGAADGYAALLVDGIYGAVTQEQRVSIDRVRQSIHHALTLIDDLHELARAETGKLSVRLGPTDLAGIIIAMGDEYEGAADAKGLRFAIDVEPDLPTAYTDPERIRQVVANLLSNAIKYTSYGGITLRARSVDVAGTQTDRCLVIEVIDTGPGIPLDKREIIFEEFERLADEKHSGAGLGLAISKRVAEVLGCEIRVESDVGRGSTFSLRVPIDKGRDSKRWKGQIGTGAEG